MSSGSVTTAEPPLAPIDLATFLERGAEDAAATPLVFRAPPLTATLDASGATLGLHLAGEGWTVQVAIHRASSADGGPADGFLRVGPDQRGRSATLFSLPRRFRIAVEQEPSAASPGFHCADFAAMPADEVELDQAHDDGWFTLHRPGGTLHLYLSGRLGLAQVSLGRDGERPDFEMNLREVQAARWDGQALLITARDQPDVSIRPATTLAVEVGLA